MIEQQPKSPTITLGDAYAKAIYGGAVIFRDRSDGKNAEDLLPKELEAQTPGAFVILLRIRAENQQEKGEFEVLLVKRKDYENLWNLPGGGIDKSENFATSAIREVEEETGLHVKLVEGTKVVMHAGPLDKESKIAGERRYDLCAGVIGVIVGGELRLNEEAAAIQWFPLDALPEGLYIKHKLLAHSYFMPMTDEIERAVAFAIQEHSFIPEGISE